MQAHENLRPSLQGTRGGNRPQPASALMDAACAVHEPGPEAWEHLAAMGEAGREEGPESADNGLPSSNLPLAHALSPAPAARQAANRGHALHILHLMDIAAKSAHGNMSCLALLSGETCQGRGHKIAPSGQVHPLHPPHSTLARQIHDVMHDSRTCMCINSSLRAGNAAALHLAAHVESPCTP